MQVINLWEHTILLAFQKRLVLVIQCGLNSSIRHTVLDCHFAAEISLFVEMDFVKSIRIDVVYLSALISDRVGCSGGLILNPSSVQQIGAVPPWRNEII